MSDKDNINEVEDNIIELTDEEGSTVKFEHLLTYEYGENFYVALLPVEPFEGMDDGEVLLMRLIEEEDDDVFLPIETEEELEGAWNAFMDIYYYQDDEDDTDFDDDNDQQEDE